MIKLEIGDELTIACEIIGASGCIFFEKDQKVIIREIVKEEGHWTKGFGPWIPERIWGIKVEDEYGIMSLKSFKETKDE